MKHVAMLQWGYTVFSILKQLYYLILAYLQFKLHHSAHREPGEGFAAPYARASPFALYT